MNMLQAETPGSGASGGTKGGRCGLEILLERIESVRQEQRKEGSFDCFAKAKDGYCDQERCCYHSECLHLSQLRYG
jgi:hypothetical protein